MEAESTTNETDPMQLRALTEIGARSPALALLLLFLVGGGAGTTAAIYVAPIVNDALTEHARDPGAHATEFGKLQSVEHRLDAIERKLDEQGGVIAASSADLKTAIRILETR